MKKLGLVENLSYDGSLLVRALFAPRAGTRVHDRRNRVLGRVTKVFGPVGEPYASVRPDAKVAMSLLGSEVFVNEGNDARQENRRGGRGH